mmetsp:Transcript_94659/g.276754  ORF Transcript_94659/g.276754 Transcript_94659/m.276754 type:complete len:249 (-) Transcript_94659:625-1371(-)
MGQGVQLHPALLHVRGASCAHLQQADHHAAHRGRALRPEALLGAPEQAQHGLVVQVGGDHADALRVEHGRRRRARRNREAVAAEVQGEVPRLPYDAAARLLVAGGLDRPEEAVEADEAPGSADGVGEEVEGLAVGDGVGLVRLGPLFERHERVHGGKQGGRPEVEYLRVQRPEATSLADLLLDHLGVVLRPALGVGGVDSESLLALRLHARGGASEVVHGHCRVGADVVALSDVDLKDAPQAPVELRP